MASYAALNLLFGIAVVLAPFAYRVLGVRDRHLKVSAKTWDHQYEGCVLGFLVAVVLTFWGVLGELATTCLLFAEIQISQRLVIFFIVVVALATLFTFRYVWISIEAIIQAQRADRANRGPRTEALLRELGGMNIKFDPDQVHAALPPWSLL